MAAATASSKSKGPIVDPALCRCCRSIKKCRLLSAEYEWKGSKEVYSDMFMDCFGLKLSNLEDGKSKDSCICATCVVRLRDANAFRRQVLQCEQAFMDAKIERDESDLNIKIVKVKSEPVWGNACDSDGDMDDGSIGDTIGKNRACHQPCMSHLKQHQHTGTKSNEQAKSKVKSNLNQRLKDALPTEKLRIKTAERKQAEKKLDSSLNKQCYEKPVAPPPKKPKLTLPREERLPQEDLMYENALTIACNSYVTPFLNQFSVYSCYYCRNQFTDPAELRKHTLTHDPKKLFKKMMECRKVPKIDITRIDCRLCEENIHDLGTLKKHLSDIHSMKLHNVTNEFLTFKLELEEVSCTECNATFPYFDVLKKHMTEHFGSLVCDQCGARFLEITGFQAHVKKKHSRIEVLYPCEKCGKNFKSNTIRKKHILTVHEKIPTFNCYKCDAMLMSHAHRNKHLIEVHGDKRKFSCKSCDKVFNTRKFLAEHNLKYHAMKVFKHQCELCEQRFYVPSLLKEHMSTHTGERNYRCDVCGKAYPRLKTLKGHMRIHANDRRYRCQICGQGFVQNCSLKGHMKSQHPD